MQRWLALLLLLALLSISAAAPLLAPYSPRQTNLEHNLQAPSRAHPLGTDLLGRDVFSRLLYGGGPTLGLALAAAALAIGIGLGLGMAALLHPWLDALISVLVDAWLSLPALLIAFVGLTLLGQGQGSIVLAVGLAEAGAFARTTRDALYATQGQPYVDGARAIGASRPRIISRHLLPNAAPLLLSFAAVIFSWALLNSAALAFLGFTGDLSTPHWGVMLAAGRESFAVQPWEALSAGLMLMLSVGCVNRLSR